MSPQVDLQRMLEEIENQKQIGHLYGHLYGMLEEIEYQKQIGR